jgi:hypothetical protein
MTFITKHKPNGYTLNVVYSPIPYKRLIQANGLVHNDLHWHITLMIFNNIYRQLYINTVHRAYEISRWSPGLPYIKLSILHITT